jgi:hypothetical protein
MNLMCEGDVRQSTPKMADGMSPYTIDWGNSYNSRIGISDGSASSRAAANPNQLSFNDEMEEDEAISKSKLFQIIDDMLGKLNNNSQLDKQAILMLSLLKEKI